MASDSDGTTKRTYHDVVHPYSGKVFKIYTPSVLIFENSDGSEVTIIQARGPDPAKWRTYKGPFHDHIKQALFGKGHPLHHLKPPALVRTVVQFVGQNMVFEILRRAP